MEALRVAHVAGPPGFGDVTFCGAGATSRVFRGIELATGRVVALKRLHRQLVRDDKALARLKREFDALRSLRHPVLVEVSDVISWEGDPTLVMAYIDGVDLKEHIARRGRLSAEEAIHVARSLFDALSLTHGSGIVHRDLKPQNVRLTPDGSVYLLDFGSARLDAASQLTATGTTVGTPEYMAPELFAGPVYDPRVDVYGVGATLYECVTGHPPQAADSLAELAQLRTSVDVPPVRSVAPDVPEALARVIDRCLARAPEDRFPTAALASWALDHPEYERRFAARRSSHPLCVHCGSAIAKESATCPVCASRQPFRYELGPCHVVLRSVENVGRFVAHVVLRFPHLGAPSELHALAERCAALSFGPQRYVSFVSERDAESIVAELAEVGARASVIREPAGWKNIVLGILCPIYLPIRLPASLLAARGSILAGSSAPRPVMPRLVTLGWATALLGSIAAYIAESTTAGFVAVAGAIVVLAGLTLGMRTSAQAPAASPQPPAVASELVLAAPGAKAKAGEGAASPAFLVLAVFMLFFEVIALSLILFFTIPSTSAIREYSKPIDPTPSLQKDVLGPQGVPVQTQARPERSDVDTSLATQLAPLAIAGALAGAMARRRRRIRKDAAAIFAELDLEKVRTLARRTQPNREELRSTHALSYAMSHDAFTKEAIRRASDLMPLLSREHAAALSQTVEALVQRHRNVQASERSLLSRCILETDPVQKLRFDLLALEGTLEAHAAAEWAAQLEQEEEERDVGQQRHERRRHVRR